MNIELIPLLEISYNYPELKSEYLNTAEDWRHYHEVCLKYAGFKDDFIQYNPNLNFYRPKDISDKNLILLIEKQFEILTEDEYTLDDIYPLSGGYLLKVDGEDELYPQCCSNLGDWFYWYSLVKFRKSVAQEAHETPNVEFNKNQIIFNFHIDRDDYYPIPKEKLIIDINSLELAYNLMIKELKEFARRINILSVGLDLNISEPVADILVFRNEIHNIKTLID